MKNFFYVIVIICFIVSCKKEKEEKETIVSGNINILVDESIFPIIEDQKDVFEKNYRAKINLTSTSEAEAVNHLLEDKARVRSEEHTSELQSRENLVCRLLLEKKNK